MKLLNLGCGAKPLKGYINIDAPKMRGSDPRIKADVYSRIEDLCFDPGSIDGIKMEAVFEHFPRHKALFLLRRFYKWLKVGGWVKVIVPDLLTTVDLIRKTKDETLRLFYFRCIFGPQDVINYGTHYDGFDIAKLERTFRCAGFNEFQAKQGGRWPSIYFTGIKKEPVLVDDVQAESNIIDLLQCYARGNKTEFLVSSWLEQCKEFR